MVKLGGSGSFRISWGKKPFVLVIHIYHVIDGSVPAARRLSGVYQCSTVQFHVFKAKFLVLSVK